MVKFITNLGTSGLQAWFIQRLTAVIFGLYIIFLLAFWLWPENQTAVAWQQLFNNNYMKHASTISFVAMLIHSWIGIWNVTTDYFKTTILRLIVQIFSYAAMIFYTIWGLQLIWL